jgi:putative endonuclease
MRPAVGPQTLGRLWEARAAAWLDARGVRTIAQGYRCRLGEIDLIGVDGQDLVIVEVRARKHDSLGTALESVGTTKQRRIIRATRHYLMRHPGTEALRIRFDVIAIDDIDTADPRFTWIRNAFEAG